MSKCIAQERSRRPHEGKAGQMIRTNDIKPRIHPKRPETNLQGKACNKHRLAIYYINTDTSIYLTAPHPPHTQFLFLLKLKIFYKREHVMHLK